MYILPGNNGRATIHIVSINISGELREDGRARKDSWTYLIKGPCVVETTLPDFIYRTLR